MNDFNDRIGLRGKMNCGEYCEIIAYYKGSKVDVKFDDGNIVKNKFYGNFKKGQISNTINHIGESNIMKCGLVATIIDYIDYHNITVKFEDGYINKNKGYNCFLKGHIGHDKVKFKKQIDYSNRIGLTKRMNCGMDCKIINYEKDKITVEFEDGTILKNKIFSHFNRGLLKNEKSSQILTSRVGEESRNKDGKLLRIIRYGGATDIDVIMDNEIVFYNKYYQSFKNGRIGNQLSVKDRSNFISKVNTNKYGESFKIIDYINYDNIIIEFDTGYKMKTSNDSFKHGRCYSPYAKTKMGIGCIGEGIYSSKSNTKMYGTWDGMFTRCYREEYQKQKPTYLNCKISEEWHNFQNFGKWYEENFYECGDELMCLDKDILNKGNKIYSADTCVFVPRNINSLFTKCDGARGDYPIGVNKYRGNNNKYEARISNYILGGNRIELGVFNTIEEAFNCYKINKEKIIKQVADQYASKYPNFPQRLYDAMYSYEVEITD